MDAGCEVSILDVEEPHIATDNKGSLNENKKRKSGNSAQQNGEVKKQRLSQVDSAKQRTEDATNQIASDHLVKHTASQSPKKRLEYNATDHSQGVPRRPSKDKKEKFIYGNYSQYYGYRNKNNVHHDIRLDVFEHQRDLFQDKQLLDIGCNTGFITMELAKRFPIKSIIGIDIDHKLINQANKCLVRHKKAQPPDNEARRQSKFPYNVSFVHGNYVLRDDVLLEIERAQFDVILCLSITKWIHLNFGDKGLKQAFRRMFLQLREGGKLILETQPFDSYKRRKKMTETIFANYQSMKFFPKDFTEYLLSEEVGFKHVELMGLPEHCVAGFKRPIQLFSKD